MSGKSTEMITVVKDEQEFIKEGGKAIPDHDGCINIGTMQQGWLKRLWEVWCDFSMCPFGGSYGFGVFQVISIVSDSATLWTIAHQFPLSMRFSRQESWSVFPCPLPGDHPYPGIKPEFLMSPVALMVKNLHINDGDVRDTLGLGRSPGEGNGYLLQYFCLENPIDRGN